MFQAGQDGGDQRLQDLLLPDAAQKAQCDAPDVLVGVLQVVAQVLADEDLQTTQPFSCMREKILESVCWERVRKKFQRHAPGLLRSSQCKMRDSAHHLWQKLAVGIRLFDRLLQMRISF